MKKPKRKRDLTATEIADLRKRGLRGEADHELARQAKRFFSTPEPPDERAERRAFFELAKRVWHATMNRISLRPTSFAKPSRASATEPSPPPKCREQLAEHVWSLAELVGSLEQPEIKAAA